MPISQIAQTIYDQLGSKFLAMTGAREFVAGDRDLRFRVPRFIVHVELRGDLYDITVFTAQGRARDSASGVYNNRLAQTIGDLTGLRVSL